jgi:hypothetical protein
MKPMNAEDYLADVFRQWLAAGFKFPSYCAYEKRATVGVPVVTFQSASALCTKALDPVDGDHLSIVKPASADAYSYIAFMAAYRREMGNVRPKAELIEQFQKVLNTLNQTQMTKSEVLFPQIETYIQDPTEQNWRNVQSTAKGLLVDIQGAVSASMAFDSRFYERGQQIILIMDGTQSTVDRSFNKPFVTARREWNGRALELKEIVTYENRPTPQELRAWAETLQQRYRRLSDEMMRLLDLIQRAT